MGDNEDGKTVAFLEFDELSHKLDGGLGLLGVNADERDVVDDGHFEAFFGCLFYALQNGLILVNGVEQLGVHFGAV